MTEQEALKYFNNANRTNNMLCILPKSDIGKCIIKALEEVLQYRAIGTVEKLQKAEKEEDILKFYYCDSEDSYLVGLRIGNFYYAHYIDGRWVFDMSRHLHWGEHVVDDTTAWKEHTYPSEPKEINFSEWLNGFIKKECGGTPEECRTAVEKQKELKATDTYGFVAIGKTVEQFEQEIRNKAIDDFSHEIKETFNLEIPLNYPSTKPFFTLENARKLVEDVAEQLKDGSGE